MKQQRFGRKTRREGGQTLILFVFFIIVLLLFVGLAVDLGFAYVTKAQLAKALDAAALTGARNIADAQVNNIVRSTFAMNYGRPGRDTAVVTPTVQIVTVGTQRRLQVAATTTINTFFIRILPNWRTLTVGANAEAIRNRIIMSIILDRSGSMSQNGGWSALPPAVDTFIDVFDDSVDRVGLVTYATTVYPTSSPKGLPVSQPFKAQIKARVPRQRSEYDGYTFSQGGLASGYAQIDNEPVATGENVIKAAVFFTDGLANTMQETVTTNCALPQPLTVTGGDGGNTYYLLNVPTADEMDTYCQASSPRPSCCRGFQSFVKVFGGRTNTVSAANIRQEAKDRGLATAQAMQRDGIIVYALGFGSNVNADWLRQVANDPASPSHDANLPSGLAFIAPTTAQINEYFKAIASDILGRLTQ